MSRLRAGGVRSAGAASLDVVVEVVGSSAGGVGAALVVVVVAASVGTASVELEEVVDVMRIVAEVAVELEPGTVMTGAGMAPEMGMVGCARMFKLQARMLVILVGRFQPSAVGSSSFSVRGQR